MKLGRFLKLIILIIEFIKITQGCNENWQIGRLGIKEFDKQQILELHNEIRGRVAMGRVPGQPPARNMQEMKWDNNLAADAQNWACLSEKHNRRLSRFPVSVGQNIATTWTRGQSAESDREPDFQRTIDNWFKEVTYYTFNKFDYTYKLTGHYTQIVWANTNLIGCGFAFYLDPSKGFTKNYICNYGPGGNILRHFPYQTGFPSCSNFGLKPSKKYQGLCENGSNYIYDMV